ncbi:hypothetical protein [uncultured Alistipes sp.]|uniref:hypothetical protein n=1 Tax=uncultured Alistipes sp. TaxID=538949 RepID=UPI0025A94A63|nr:hypothetical protein [uncultured Alistipes sp.]
MATISLEERRQKAVELVAEITVLKNSLNSIFKETNSLFSGIKSNDKIYKSLVEKLDIINKETVIAIAGFKGDKNKIIKLLNEAEKFYKDKYSPLAAKYAIKKKEFVADTISADKERKKFEKLKRDCMSQYNEIVLLGKNYKARIIELKKIENAMQNLHRAAEQNKGKIDKLQEAVTLAQKEATISNSNIKVLERECISLTKNIRAYARESDVNNQKIVKLHRDSETKLAEIQRIYEIASETGLGGEFEKRRNSLNAEIKKWEIYILATSILLFVGIIGLFIFQLGINQWVLNATFDLNFYVRFLIFSPVVYYLYFISIQYSKAKQLHDKYAFKVTLSMTIKSHIELLTQQGYFKEEKHLDQILGFVLDGFRNIYCEPNNSSDDYKMRIKLADVEIELQKKIIDKLAELAPKKS